MAFSLTNWLTPDIIGVTGGGGILGFVGGHLKSHGGKVAALEKEVEACRQRDAQIIVIKACFRAIAGEMISNDPRNPVLKMCGDLIATKLPVTPEERALDGFEDLMAELSKIPGTKELRGE